MDGLHRAAALGFALLLAGALTIGPRTSRPAQAAPSSRTLRLAVLLANFTDDRSRPQTPAQVRQSVFTATRSAANYWRESTGDAVTITGDVFGWYALDSAGASCNEPDQWAAWLELAKDAARRAGVNLGAYDHFMVWTPFESACEPYGLSGQGDLGGVRSWVQPPPYWGPEKWWAWAAHELGHNLNLAHSGALACGNVALKRSTARCNSQDYGDPFDIMGASWLAGRLTTNLHKVELGVETMQDAAGGETFLLAPASPPAPSRTQAIRILRSDGTAFFLEYRRPFGTFDDFPPTDPAVLGVTVRLISFDGSRALSRLLDMTPDGNFEDSSLRAGMSFTDPLDGKTITVTSVDTSGARITIEGGVSARVVAGVLTVTGTPAGDVLTVTGAAAGRYRVTSATPVAAGAGCSAATPTSTVCDGVTRAVVRSRGGNDTLDTKDGRAETVVCKGGDDTVTADWSDRLTGCEHILR
jgi:hypothetical protein